jgi:hypothetical protein
MDYTVVELSFKEGKKGLPVLIMKLCQHSVRVKATAPIPNATYRRICGLGGTFEVLALAGFVADETSSESAIIDVNVKSTKMITFCLFPK